MLIPIIPSEQVKAKKIVTEINDKTPTVPSVPTIKKDLMIPIISGKEVTELRVRTKKVPTGARPVIPTGDTCCTQVCTIINNKVKSIEEDIRLRQEELDAIKEGLVLEKVKILVPKKGEMEKKGAKKGAKIQTEEVEKERKFSVSYSESRAALKRQQFSLIHQLSALKNIRYDMLQKGSCKCIEEVKFAEIEIP